ncbi:pentatricopeptide repeat-containing protein At3g12770-like [Dioscorea cayenensis subsp. rotundata]|uniref:Pentatricopeptide repeat-containing protein At3g12770-like n=1 Tax=Dioscorea cayennensis subsp. rotundata TaxID=55577 RepID=A0AB40ATJ5_DIOCR|nr:pentatricopeptide repeat-containing protein At3g12770-like [Dioscorea cayenensis subsp. rotundata]
MITCGVLIQNTYLNTKLCAMYAASGNMPAARVIFDGIVLKSSFLWNVMVRGYACNNCSLDSLVLYRDMLSFGRGADNFTYPFVLMACGHLLLVEVGERIHGEVVVSGFESDVYVANSLVSMYSKFGQMGIARNLFDRMPQRDLTSWNTMLSGYVKNGYPDVALSLLSLLSVSDVRMDRATLVGVLPACAALGAVKQGKEIHAYILRSSLEFDGFWQMLLIDVYVNSNFVIGARRLFERMSERDIISWNALISGCAAYGDPMECLSLFCLMNSEGLLVADVITLIAVLGACDRTSALQFGRITHAYLIKRGFDKEIIVGTALIDMYVKCGSLACSCHAFDEMESKNLISWSAMVSGYGLHGKGKEAISFNEGKELFNQMSDENSIKPSIEHYSCMVDLLGRAGQLDEAYKLIMDMDIRPNADVWAALLSACHTHRNVELAEIAALHLRTDGLMSIESEEAARRNGYTPDTSSVFYDVADDAKEDLLWDHSEKASLLSCNAGNMSRLLAFVIVLLAVAASGGAQEPAASPELSTTTSSPTSSPISSPAPISSTGVLPYSIFFSSLIPISIHISIVIPIHCSNHFFTSTGSGSPVEARGHRMTRAFPQIVLKPTPRTMIVQP